MKLAWFSVLILFLSLSVDGQTSADLILINANIRTMDTKLPRAEALAVRDGRIVAVGRSNEVRKLAGESTRVIDAQGKLVVPGFNDAHVHFTAIGNRFSHLALKDARSSKDILGRIAFYTSILPKGRWLLGGGLGMPSKDLPTLAELDAVSADNPLLIYLSDHKSILVNSAALKRARIVQSSPIVLEPALAKVRYQVPIDYERNWAELAETASNYAASLGVTSVQDVHSDDVLEVLKTLASSGRLKTRVYECIGIHDRKRSIAAGLRAASGDPFVRGGCVKGFAGDTDEEIVELRRAILESDKAGLQVMVHAIGARSNAEVLGAFEAAIAANGRRERRFRVEHAARMRPVDIPRLARSAIVASMQPDLFGAGSDDFRALLYARTMLAFGSDASIGDFDPLLGIHAAVNSGSRSITVEEAVRAYTLGSAYAEFQEKEKGTLAVGKLADLVILSLDIFTIDGTQIRNATVSKTIVNGKVVFESDANRSKP